MSESTAPTPEPMTDEQRAEIRDAAQPGYADILAQLIKHGAHDDPKHGKVIVHGVTVVPAADLKAAVRVVWYGAPALLAEVERLRTERDDVVAELKEERLTSDALRKNRDQLNDELTAARAELTTRTGERDEARRAWLQEHILRDKAETERDRLAEQVKRVHALSARLRAVDEIEEDALADRIDAALEDVVAMDGTEATS